MNQAALVGSSEGLDRPGRLSSRRAEECQAAIPQHPEVTRLVLVVESLSLYAFYIGLF